jgi:hypothetical protein
MTIRLSAVPLNALRLERLGVRRAHPSRRKLTSKLMSRPMSIPYPLFAVHYPLSTS